MSPVDVLILYEEITNSKPNGQCFICKLQNSLSYTQLKFQNEWIFHFRVVKLLRKFQNVLLEFVFVFISLCCLQMPYIILRLFSSLSIQAQFNFKHANFLPENILLLLLLFGGFQQRRRNRERLEKEEVASKMLLYFSIRNIC